MSDSDCDSLFVKNGWSDIVDHAAGFVETLAERGHPGGTQFWHTIGILAFAFLSHFELHDGGHQVLGQTVVNFVGNQSPLVIARLPQLQ